MVPATVVDPTELWQTVAAAAVAGIGVTVVFSIAILGFARYSESNRVGRPAASVLWLCLGLSGLVATVAAIVFGVIVMTTK